MFRIQHAEKKHNNGVRECFSSLDFGGRHSFEESVLSPLIEQQRLFVAIKMAGSLEEQVVGAMALEYDDRSYEILAIACRADCTRKGVGTALIRLAVEKCRAEHVPKLWCWSLDRYNAKLFYEKQGFDEGFLLRQQFFGEDCWLFGKSVDLVEDE